MAAEVVAWGQAHVVAVVTLRSGVRSGKAAQKRGHLNKACTTEASGVAFELQGTAKVAQGAGQETARLSVERRVAS